MEHLYGILLILMMSTSYQARREDEETNPSFKMAMYKISSELGEFKTGMMTLNKEDLTWLADGEEVPEVFTFPE